MDELIITPAAHAAVGAGVLLASSGAALVAGRGALVRRRFGRLEQGAWIAAQVLLLVQLLVGIKLLDQGLGTLQKYVHYLGGLGALGLLLLHYWLPPLSGQAQARRALGLAVASLVFVALSFFVGQLYVRG